MAQGWSISPAGASINSNGQATFPANGTSSDIVYTITYEDANGCTGNTTYTVPACTPPPCEDEWKLVYEGGQSSDIGFPLTTPKVGFYYFSIQHYENGSWVKRTDLGNKVVVTENCSAGSGMLSYSTSVGTYGPPDCYSLDMTFNACPLRDYLVSFEVTIPEICPDISSLTFSGRYGMEERKIIIKPKSGSMPASYSIYLNFKVTTKCDSSFTCCEDVPCGGNITDRSNKIRVPIDGVTSDTTKVVVTSIDAMSGFYNPCEQPASMKCTHNDTDYIEFEWDTSYC